MKKYQSSRNKKSAFKKGFERKGFYIVLFACAILAGTVSVLNREARRAASNFDDEAWRAAVAESSAEEPSPSGGEGEAERVVTPVPVAAPERTQPALERTQPEPEQQPPAVEAFSEAEAVETAAEDVPPSLRNPLVGGVQKGYSADELVYSETMQDWRVHNGLDIAAAVGTQVRAAADGVVEQVYEDDLLGVVVVIGHSGRTKTLYANLQNPDFIRVGRKVSAGDIIGGVGTTAAAESTEEPHLHFEVLINQENVDPNLLLKA